MFQVLHEASRLSYSLLVCLQASPVFSKVTIQLAKPNAPITIMAYDNSATNIYIQRASINGKAIDMKNAPFISHSDIVGPAQPTLEFWMGPNPVY
jgi:putative alpha-1,2-mannosidase